MARCIAAVAPTSRSATLRSEVFRDRNKAYPDRVVEVDYYGEYKGDRGLLHPVASPTWRSALQVGATGRRYRSALQIGATEKTAIVRSRWLYDGGLLLQFAEQGGSAD